MNPVKTPPDHMDVDLNVSGQNVEKAVFYIYTWANIVNSPQVVSYNSITHNSYHSPFFQEVITSRST